MTNEERAKKLLEAIENYVSNNPVVTEAVREALAKRLNEIDLKEVAQRTGNFEPSNEFKPWPQQEPGIDY